MIMMVGKQDIRNYNSRECLSKGQNDKIINSVRNVIRL